MLQCPSSNLLLKTYYKGNLNFFLRVFDFILWSYLYCLCVTWWNDNGLWQELHSGDRNHQHCQLLNISSSLKKIFFDSCVWMQNFITTAVKKLYLESQIGSTLQWIGPFFFYFSLSLSLSLSCYCKVTLQVSQFQLLKIIWCSLNTEESTSHMSQILVTFSVLCAHVC